MDRKRSPPVSTCSTNGDAAGGDSRSLSSEQFDRIQKAFSAIDTDSDGSIEVLELKAALEILGVDSMKHEEVWETLASLDRMRGENGRPMTSINFREFSRLASDRMQRESTQAAAAERPREPRAPARAERAVQAGSAEEAPQAMPTGERPWEPRAYARAVERGVQAGAADEAGRRASTGCATANVRQANAMTRVAQVLEAANRRAQSITEHYMMKIEREVAYQIETLVTSLHEDNARVLTQLVSTNLDGTEVAKETVSRSAVSFASDQYEAQAPQGPRAPPEAPGPPRPPGLEQRELKAQMLLPGGVPDLYPTEDAEPGEVLRCTAVSQEEKGIGLKSRQPKGKLSVVSKASKMSSRSYSSRGRSPSVLAANAILKTRGKVTLREQAFEAATWDKAMSDFLGDDLSELGGLKLERLQEEADAKRKLFVDVHELKDRVRHALIKKKYNVKDLYKTTGLAQYIAKTTAFEIATMLVVVANCAWIWVDSDLNGEAVLARAEIIFQVMEHAFCTYFTLEWAIRFLAFAKTKDALKDRWFAFDSILFCMTVTDTWIMTLIYIASTSAKASLGMDASILKLCRMMRLTRMCRMARLVRYMPELLVILRGLWISSKSVLFTLLLLLFTIFVFGITFRQLTDSTPVGDRYFYSVHGSMISLFLHGTLPDLAEMVLALADQSLGLGLLLVLFILIATLTIMNMLVGVLVESVATVSQIENETLMVNMVRAKMLQMIEALNLDVDGNGALSREEFEELLVLPDAAQFIQEVGVDVVGLVEYSDFIFKEKDMSFEDFVELILQLRGTNTATVKDIVDLRKQVMQEMESISRIMTQMSKESSDRITNVLKLHRAQDALERKATQSLELEQQHSEVCRPRLRQPQHCPPPRSLPPLLRGQAELLDESGAHILQESPLHRDQVTGVSSWSHLGQIEV